MALEVGKDELDKRKEGIKAGAIEPTTNDITTILHASKNMRYKWVNNAPSRVARHKGRGYTIVPLAKNDTDPKPLVDDWREGAYRLGNMVLMHTTQTLYQKRVCEIDERARRREEGSRQQAKDEIDRIARDAGLSKPHQSVVIDETTHA